MLLTRVKLFFQIILLLVLVTALTLAPLTARMVHAETDTSTGWFDGTPTLTEGLEQSSSPLQLTDCADAKITVLRNHFSFQENHCMVETDAGLIDSYSTVIEPPGQGRAYPIEMSLGGNPYVVPIPGQAGALYVKGGTRPWCKYWLL